MQNRLELIWKELHKELDGFIFSHIKDREITNDILQDEITKSYKDYWYFVKMKRLKDLG